MNKPASFLATVIFLLIAALHLLRVVYQVHVTIGDIVIPLWASIPPIILFGGLGVWVWLERRR